MTHVTLSGRQHSATQENETHHVCHITDEVTLQRKFICILLFMTSPKNNVVGNVNKVFVLGALLELKFTSI